MGSGRGVGIGEPADQRNVGCKPQYPLVVNVVQHACSRGADVQDLPYHAPEPAENTRLAACSLITPIFTHIWSETYRVEAGGARLRSHFFGVDFLLSDEVCSRP